MDELIELLSEDEWRKGFECLKELRPNLRVEKFLEGRESLISRGYHLIGLVSEGRVVCIAGYALHPHVERGSEFWLHDFVTLAEQRSKGFGLKMITYLEEQAKKHGCQRFLLHTRDDRLDAHRFYEEKSEFGKYAVVFKKEL